MANISYYVVWVGKLPGIYESWNECSTQVKNFKNSQYKKYPSFEEAYEAIQKSPPHAPWVLPPQWPFYLPKDVEIDEMESTNEDPCDYASSSSNQGGSREDYVRVTTEDKGKRVTIEGRAKHVGDLMKNLHM